MSRTNRSKDGIKYHYFRKPVTKKVQTDEHYASQELEEQGYHPGNRQKARGNPSSGKIVDSYDDLGIASWQQLDYHKKKRDPYWWTE